MRFAQRVGLAAGAVAAVAVLAGCGTTNGSLLTPGAATQLTAELNQATTALNDYNCQVAYQAVSNFRDDVNQLAGVNATLVKMLATGASRISALADERCPNGISASTTTTSTSTETTATGTTTTSTSVTTTTPASTTTTSDTSTDSGGAAPTTATTSTLPASPPASTATAPATTPDSGGAGLNGSGGGGDGGPGVGGANGQ